MTNCEIKPYVISADTFGLMQSWALGNALVMPTQNYFDAMNTDLKNVLEQYFKSVDVVPEQLLAEGLNGFVQKSRLPIISLDRAYIRENQENLMGFLDVTRVVDPFLESQGLGSRQMTTSVEQQISRYANRWPKQNVALLDDVVFEGGTLIDIIGMFRQKGMGVNKIFTGIAIKEGQNRLEQAGLDVEALVVYDTVIDEVCERDFRIGAPLSGRTIMSSEKIEGVPYVYPFGKPVEWASIPATKANEFSLFCLDQSLDFWKKTEQLSQRSVPTKQLAKPVFGLPDKSSVAKAIQEIIFEFKRR